MQSLLSYIVVSDKDDSSTKYKLPKSVLSLIGMETPVTAVFTGVFGVRSNTALLPYLNKVLNPAKGERICPVQVDFPIDLKATAYHGLKDGDVKIAKSKTLNTLRLRSDLIHKIQDIWQECGAAEKSDSEARFPYKPTSYPQYIDVFRAPNNYPKLELIVYQVNTPVGTIAVASAYIKPENIKPWLSLKGSIEL